jgi:hypothetical protein
MAHLFLAIFLIVFGLNMLLGLSLPIWILGILALIAGILLLLEHFRVRLVARTGVVGRVDPK